MATRKSYLAKSSYRYLSAERGSAINNSSEPIFEFDEPDLWNVSNQIASPEFKKSSSAAVRSSSRVSSMKLGNHNRIENDHNMAGATAASLPVNIPDWSKILRKDYGGNNRRRENDDCGGVEDEEEDGDEENRMIPPHEFLARQFARTRISCFSVYEGIGRTLKGRDLSRVRDAILKKTGFED